MERIQLLKEIARRHGVSPTQNNELKLSEDTGSEETKSERLLTDLSTLSGTTSQSTETTGLPEWSLETSRESSGKRIPATESVSPDQVAPNIAMMRQVLWQTMLDMKADKISIERAREVSQAANVIYKFVRLELDAAKLAQKKPT